ncbi:unnamed protein product [Darwinula stevensoni]|uniref:Dilute domain-containing protein n=1 Tax=Darwinula stevensoni TaxID=69355 RepID=A0A7R9A993_9CRUS|nr:unnamed protein product [Darwinula stevensoni]CAG0897085.1 unnamed protein product [Darwinula stevensoni]
MILLFDCPELKEELEKEKEQNRKLKRTLQAHMKQNEKLKGTDVEKVDQDLKSTEVAQIKHKVNQDYMGIFEFKSGMEGTIAKHLIVDLKPKVAQTLLPGLPAYILFMCLRYTDHINDENRLRAFLVPTISGIKKVVKKRQNDLDTMVLWLTNTSRLTNCLRQYSGEKNFQSENTPKQNSQCLRHFDLNEYRNILNDVCVWVFMGMLKLIQERVQNMIVPGVLENEAIAGLSGPPVGSRTHASSVGGEDEVALDPRQAMALLLRELDFLYETFDSYGMDPQLVPCIFQQLFYFICAVSLNNLLLRKNLCHWSKGLQIRYNLSSLEDWGRSRKMNGEVLDSLKPVIQASQLLQAKKSDENVAAICEMCNKLTPAQINKLLMLYTPADEYEEKVAPSFIRKVQSELARTRGDATSASPGPMQTTLLMDTKFTYAIRFPFTPSSIRLEDIELPSALRLNFLNKI